MRAMKDSGIEWIGDIPEEWNIIRNKYLLNFEKGKLPTSTNKEQIGQPYIGASDLDSKNEYNLYTEDETLSDVDYDDLLILWDGANAGKCAHHKRGKLSSTMMRIRSKGKIYPGFLYWYYKGFEDFMYTKVTGTTIPHMNIRFIEDIRMVDIPFYLQQHIADYLDKKCAEIDAIITKQQSIIEKLKEYKLSLITETVTKGLNTDVEMKDSGIEWIGEVPKHWEIKSFRHILKERNEKNIPVKSKERLSLSIELGVTLYAEKTTNLDRFKDDYEQYKIAHIGDLVMNSMNMIVGASGVSKYYGCVSPAYYTFYDEENDHIKAKFCEYIFRSKTMQRVLFSLGKGIYAIVRGDDRVNTCRLKVSKTDLKNIKIPLPPAKEIRSIINYLEGKCIKIDSVITKKQALIEKLTEYKKSLIYEVVTGKKEV